MSIPPMYIPVIIVVDSTTESTMAVVVECPVCFSLVIREKTDEHMSKLHGGEQ